MHFFWWTKIPFSSHQNKLVCSKRKFKNQFDWDYPVVSCGEILSWRLKIWCVHIQYSLFLNTFRGWIHNFRDQPILHNLNMSISSCWQSNWYFETTTTSPTTTWNNWFDLFFTENQKNIGWILFKQAPNYYEMMKFSKCCNDWILMNIQI